MKTFQDLIGQWETLEAFRAAVGVPYQRARKWRDRNSIPHPYWAAVVKASKKKGIKGVHVDSLAAMSEASREAA